MRLFLISVTIFLLIGCEEQVKFLNVSSPTTIIPIPKKVNNRNTSIVLDSEAILSVSEEELSPIANAFLENLNKTTGYTFQTVEQENKKAVMSLEIDELLSDEGYVISINDKVTVRGGSAAAIAYACQSIIQIAGVLDGKLLLPQVEIVDKPDASYRGLLIDLAREWHELEEVKQLIDLAAYYKTNYLHLHFTDYQSYTLPSKSYPKLSTKGRSYSWEDLHEMESYAQARGVTIIPEIEIPGHSSPFVEKYPEIFAIQDTATNPWIINMGNPAVYSALETIFKEIATVFISTPYFHIGGDEAIFTAVADDPQVKTYMKDNDLGSDVEELYRHFIKRMNNIIKGLDKQMCIWEGFGPDGTIEIPKDILVFAFETNKYLPNQLVEDGYTVVNTSWKPLYVVNEKKWEPKTIYDWNMWQWSNWWPSAPSFETIQVEKSSSVIGAQMCSWEQQAKNEIPSLRMRFPTFMERVWNTEKVATYTEFNTKLQTTDAILSEIIEDSRQDSVLYHYNYNSEN